MAGTIVTDRIESDASYASRINVASEIQFSNTITGNVNIDSGLLFVDAVNNRVGIGVSNPESSLDVRGTTSILRMQSTTGTNSVYQRLTNDGGQLYLGIDNSAGNDLVTGSSAYAGVLVAPGTTRSLHLGTNGTARLSIDSTGRVTMPAQPSFQAYLTTSWNLSNGTTVPFNATSWNIGSHYNTSNYRFTAPVAGIYAFYTHSYTSVSSGAVRAMHFQFRVNGTLRLDSTNGGFSPDGGYSYHPAQNNFVTIQLSVNDYVDFYLNGGDYGSGTNFNGGSAYTVFGGYLIG